MGRLPTGKEYLNIRLDKKVKAFVQSKPEYSLYVNQLIKAQMELEQAFINRSENNPK